MNRYVVAFALLALVAGLLAVPLAPDNLVDAGDAEKIHFTETVRSSQNPGQGQEDSQLAMILSPNEGTIYDGSMTFAASSPVQVAILHEIGPRDAGGQPTWTVDGKTVYGLSLLADTVPSDSVEFTGAALALYSAGSEPFTATVSTDGWTRGQPTEIVMQRLEIEREEPAVLLHRAHVPAVIPMHEALYNGEQVLYIMTDSSDTGLAQSVSESQDWRVTHAPAIAGAPQDALQDMYVFANGVRGAGLYGYQPEVFSGTPEEPGYGALAAVIEITWKKGQNRTLLESAQDILDARDGGRIEFDETGTVVNVPQIVWPGGQMTVREGEIADDMEYGGGQITGIDTDGMTVSFVAHRGWGPDGRTIYCIVAGATPTGTADVMGVTHSPALDGLIASAAAADLFQFQNGIKSSGPLGFQAGIAGAAPGDGNYSPMWRVYIAEWNDPKTAKILETRQDIDSLKKEDLLSVSIARPMNSVHIVNCPIIDPFQ